MIIEISKERFLKESTMKEKKELAEADMPKLFYGVYDDKTGLIISHCGIAEFSRGKGEVWNHIENYSRSMTSALVTRDLLDYIRVTKEYKVIVASAESQNLKYNRWLKWLKFKKFREYEIDGVVFNWYYWGVV